jgi:hypothetical protein
MVRFDKTAIVASSSGSPLFVGARSTRELTHEVIPCFPRRWTSHDDDRIRSLAVAGKNLRSAAIEMNRSYVSVLNRAAKLNVRFATRSRQSDHESRSDMHQK